MLFSMLSARDLNTKSGACHRRMLVAIFFVLVSALTLRAGPPFLTDDPEPVDRYHWEFYVFGQGDHTVDANAVAAPAFEFNYGVAPDTQLHVVAPMTMVSPAGMDRATGYGDTELGVKYRFVTETDSRPQVGIFPMAELATGSSSRGLGNRRT